jgi:general secretion pathway protein C
MLLLAYSLAGLVQALLPDAQPTPAALGDPFTAGTQPRAEAGAPPAARFAGHDLFGPAPPPVAELPESDARLTLHGVVLSERPEETRSIIAGPDGRHVAYPLNARLPGGGEVVEVQADRVVLLRGGRHEALRLAMTEPSATADNRDNETMARILGRLQRTLQATPASLIGVVNFQPLREHGRITGYRLAPGRDPGLLESLGLQPGDVVRGIDGVALDSLPRTFDMVQRLTDADEFRLDVTRGNQKLSLAYRVRR